MVTLQLGKFFFFSESLDIVGVDTFVLKLTSYDKRNSFPERFVWGLIDMTPVDFGANGKDCSRVTILFLFKSYKICFWSRSIDRTYSIYNKIHSQ